MTRIKNKISPPTLSFSRYAVLLLAGLILWSITGCSAGRKAGKAEDMEAKKLEDIFRKLAERQLQSDWMDARARIKYEDEAYQVGAMAQIRVKKDSAIWVSVRKLGFEVARVLIQPDSVFVVDRVNNEYMKKPLNAIKEFIDLPANFQVIQSLVYGNPVFFSQTRPRLEIMDRSYKLSVNTPEMKSQYLIDEDFLLKSLDVQEVRSGQNLLIQFEDYQIENGNQNFSYIRMFKIDSPASGKATLDVRFSKVEFNIPKNISFDIPDKYTRMD